MAKPNIRKVNIKVSEVTLDPDVFSRRSLLPFQKGIWSPDMPASLTSATASAKKARLVISTDNKENPKFLTFTFENAKTRQSLRKISVDLNKIADRHRAIEENTQRYVSEKLKETDGTDEDISKVIKESESKFDKKKAVRNLLVHNEECLRAELDNVGSFSDEFYGELATFIVLSREFELALHPAEDREYFGMEIQASNLNLH